jgi:hypothetical protein
MLYCAASFYRSPHDLVLIILIIHIKGKPEGKMIKNVKKKGRE